MMKVICLLRLTKALVIPQRWKYGRLQKKKEKQESNWSILLQNWLLTLFSSETKWESLHSYIAEHI